MNEYQYYVEVQYADGTCAFCADRNDDPLYFEDIRDACLYAKGQIDETYVLARVINAQTRRVENFFK